MNEMQNETPESDVNLELPETVVPQQVILPPTPEPVVISQQVQQPQPQGSFEKFFNSTLNGMVHKKHELSDLFEVPQPHDNDMEVEDLFTIPDEELELDPEEAYDDLTKVSREDIMGRPPKRKVRPVRFVRTNKPFNNNSIMGGIR